MRLMFVGDVGIVTAPCQSGEMATTASRFSPDAAGRPGRAVCRKRPLPTLVPRLPAALAGGVPVARGLLVDEVMRIYTYCWGLSHRDGMEAEIRVCAPSARLARFQVRALLGRASAETMNRFQHASVTRIEPRESPDVLWKPQMALQELGAAEALPGRRAG
jgi:hypothetical protein